MIVFQVDGMLLRRAGLLALFCFALGAATSFAKVTSTSTYEVEGCQLSEVWDDIQKKGPADGSEVHAGEAETKLGVSFTPDVQCKEIQMEECRPEGIGHECKAILNVTYALETTITLPSWPGSKDSCEKAQAEWKRFMEKLTEHEHGHDKKVQAALDAAKPAPKTMFMSLPFRSCDPAEARKQADAALADLQKELDTELDRLGKIMKEANEAYDKETGHGATEGAKLDTSIVCEKKGSPKEQLEEIRSELDFVEPKKLREKLQKSLDKALKDLEPGKNEKPKAEKARIEKAKKSIDKFIKELEKAKKSKKKKEQLDKEVADDFIKRAKEARDGL